MEPIPDHRRTHLSLCTEPPCRAVLERFIASRFADRYGARVRHFMPDLLGLSDEAGRLHAAVGLREASSGPLFLERYLDRPIEAEVARVAGRPTARGRIIEVGNLAALGNGQARRIIVELTDLLVGEGFDWVVFTATNELANSFHRLALAPLVLGEADPARLGDERGDWGRYYDARPRVMAGFIRGGFERLQRRGVFRQYGHRPVASRIGGDHVAVA